MLLKLKGWEWRRGSLCVRVLRTSNGLSKRTKILDKKNEKRRRGTVYVWLRWGENRDRKEGRTECAERDRDREIN